MAVRRLSFHVLFVLLALLVLIGCGANTSPSRVTVPGAETSAKSTALEAGAAMLQAMPPIQQLNLYLDGFHFYADDIGHQIEAHHYCSILNEEFHQCAIYDGNGSDAKLIGLEYIVSERLFAQLPPEEKAFWHSHRYEVKSGQLIMPGIPTRVEHEAMEKLVTTYGKTWHAWHTDRGDRLPYGIPQLMMGFTADGQANSALIQARDRRFDTSTDAKAQDRQGIPVPTIQRGADAWQGGTTVQLGTQEMRVRNIRGDRVAR
jgi:Protein of unknown function (DUF1264)